MSEEIEDISSGILGWIHSILPEIPAVSAPLGARERPKGIDVRLLALTPRPSPRTLNPPTVIDLDYLVTASFDDAGAEQHALAELLLAAADRRDFDVLAARSAAETCAALGIPVAAGFILRTPLMRSRVVTSAPLVRFPMKVATADIGPVDGAVLGPGDIPVAGAVVSIPGIGREVRTDAHGRFRIAGAPRDPQGLRLHVKARGVEIDASAKPGESVLVRLPLEV